MDIQKVFYEFSERHPSYAQKVDTYKLGKNNSLEFKLKDGTTAWYFPVETKSKVIVLKDDEI